MELGRSTSSCHGRPLVVRVASTADTQALAPRLRRADIAEIRAVSGEAPLQALERAVAWSDPCYAAGREELAVALFGVVPDRSSATTRAGRIWMLGADDIATYRFAVARLSRPWVARLQQRYHCLWNYVDVRNQLHIRWLDWCGFKLIERVAAYGHERRPFFLFERCASSASLSRSAATETTPSP